MILDWMPWSLYSSTRLQADWQEYGAMETFLKFDVDMPQDFFYFCHIHSGMSGRVKLVNADGNKLSEANKPELPYEYDIITPFDDSCGGFDLHQWQLPHPQCPSQFVCGVDDLPTQILTEEGGGPTPLMSQNTFASCVDSMNCFMLNGMTTNYGGEELTNGGTDDIVLFLRQMIPHHQNAVNMAKGLLKSNTATCGDLAIEEGSSVAVGCLLEPIARGIINTQNHQIQTMKGLLEFVGAKETNDCKIGGHEETMDEATEDDESLSSAGSCEDQMDVILADDAVTTSWNAIEKSMIAKEQRWKDPESPHLILTFDFAAADTNLMNAYVEAGSNAGGTKVVSDATMAMSCTAETRSTIDYEIRVQNFPQYTGIACDDESQQQQFNVAATAFAVTVVDSHQDGVACEMRLEEVEESGAGSFSWSAAVASAIPAVVALF